MCACSIQYQAKNAWKVQYQGKAGCNPMDELDIRLQTLVHGSFFVHHQAKTDEGLWTRVGSMNTKLIGSVWPRNINGGRVQSLVFSYESSLIRQEISPQQGQHN